MNKILKKIATLGCAFVMMTTPLACAGTNPNPQPDVDPENPPVVEETEQEKAERLYAELIESMKNGNFTVETEDKVYKFDNGKVEFDGGVYFTENGKNVCVIDGVKRLTNFSVEDAMQEMLREFDGINFATYFGDSLVGAQQDGYEAFVKVSDGKIEITAKQQKATVSNFGTTVVNMPTVTEDRTDETVVVKSMEEAIAEVSAFLSEVKENQKFTYTKTENSKEEKYSFLNGLLKVEKDGVVTIYEEDGGQKYAYSQQDGAWNKDFTQQSISSILETFDAFANGVEKVSWSEFDAQKAQLSGSYKGQPVTVTLNGDNITFQIGDLSVNVSKNVENFAKPEQVTDNTIQSEKLWETVDGQRVYNYKLLAQTLEDWIKENDGYLKEMFAGGINSYDKLLSIEIKDNSFRFKNLITNSNGKSQIYDIEFHPTWFSSILAEENNTASAMKEYFSKLVQEKKYPIRPINTSKIDLEYTSLNATPEQKTQMDGLTQSVFNELATEGWKTDSWENVGTKVADLKDAKILFSAKGEIVFSGDAYSLGPQSNWYQYYLIENKGNLEWVSVKLASAKSYNCEPEERVIGDVNNLWFVFEPTRTPLDKGNTQLYDNLLKTSAKSLNL